MVERPPCPSLVSWGPLSFWWTLRKLDILAVKSHEDPLK